MPCIVTPLSLSPLSALQQCHPYTRIVTSPLLSPARAVTLQGRGDNTGMQPVSIILYSEKVCEEKRFDYPAAEHLEALELHSCNVTLPNVTLALHECNVFPERRRQPSPAEDVLSHAALSVKHNSIKLKNCPRKWQTRHEW